MSDVLKFGKKVFTVSVVGTTMLWSLGVAALLPAVANAAVCPTLNAGDMIKVSGHAAIYSVNAAGKVLYFPSGDEFKSWSGLSATAANQYAGYMTVTQDCFDSLSVPSSYPGAVNYRPGSYVVKRPSSDQLYVVEPGNKLAKVSLADANALYGVGHKTMTVADAFWPHYVNRGADVAGAVTEGMLVSNGGMTWYVDSGNVLRQVTAAGMTANRFKSAFVHAVPASYLAGTSVGSVIDSLVSALSNRTQDGAIAPGPVVTGGTVNVSLAADNPAAANLADGSAYNSVLKLTLSAGSATNVTGITLTKTGLIANANVTGVSVWDSAGNRHGDVMTSLTSDNKVTISFGTNPIMVAAGGSESLLVKVNISSAANSGLVGFSVAAATDLVSNGTVGGSFPIAGNQMSIIDGNASLASTTVTAQAEGGAAASGTGNTNVGDMAKEVGKFRFTENSGNEDIQVSRVTFYFEGSVQDGDLANFSVYAPDGTKLGSAAAMSSRYVTVNLTPYTVPKSTNRDLTLKVDVMNGSGRWFRAHIQNDYDVLVKGVSTGFYTLPQSFADQVGATSYYQMNAGTLTVNKAATSPSGNISSGAQGIVLAKFDVKAVGEAMELRKMGLGVFKTGANGTGDKNLTGNVVVRDAADGTVYLTVAASTASLYAGGAQNNLSNYISIAAGANKSLEVVGSIDSTDTSTKYTVQVGDFYAKRFSSLDFADNLPTSGVTSTAANQLTVNATALTCNKDTSMGNVTRAPGATTVIGQFICTAGSSEGVRLTNMTIKFPTVMNTALTDMFQNLELWNGSTQLGTTLATLATSSNNFNFDISIEKNQTVTLQVKAYVLSNANGASSSTIDSYNYTGKDSGNSTSATADVNGQNVTSGAGTLTITAVSDATTISRIYGPNQTGVQLGKWKMAAANADVTLSKLTLTSITAATAVDVTTLGTFGSFSLYEGANLLGTANYVAGDVVFSGMASTVTMDSYKVYTLKGNTNGSGVITNNSAMAFVVKSDSNTDMEARSQVGALLTTGNIVGATGETGDFSRFGTSTKYIFHDAYPTAVAQSLGTSLDLGSNTKIFKYTITNSGARDMTISTSTMTVNVSGLSYNSAGTATGTIGDWRLYEDNGAGGLGTFLASTSTVGLGGGAAATSTAINAITYSTAGSLLVRFDSTDDQNSMLDQFVIAPGASRTLIMTANTAGIGDGKAAGGVVVASVKIAGSTGWSGSAWNTGNLGYFYTPVGGSQTVELSASDSYDVAGSAMSHSF